MNARRLDWQYVTDKNYMMIGRIDIKYARIRFRVYRDSYGLENSFLVKGNLKGLPSLTCFTIEDVMNGAQLILSKFIHSLIQS